MYSTSLWRVGAIFCWGQRCWVFLYIGWNYHNSRPGGHSGWCYSRFLCFAATFSREITNSARKYRQNCIVKENLVILQQQIPPRFPFEQRTRAELRFYRDMDYTKNALDYTQILTQLKKHRGRNSTKGADVYWFWLTVLFIKTHVVYTLVVLFLTGLSVYGLIFWSGLHHFGYS